MRIKIPYVIAFLLTLALAICFFMFVSCPIGTADILKLAEKEGVPVYVVSNEDLEPIAKQHGHETAFGVYFEASKEIYIDQDAIDLLYILAHEMGHHYAISYEGDHSEERADEIAYELIFTGQYHRIDQQQYS